VYNLNLNSEQKHSPKTERKQPTVEVATNPYGDMVGIKVKREHHSTYYHRSDRNCSDIFHPSTGELKPIFSSLKSFLQFSKKLNVLDLGCGGGSLVQELSRHSVNIRGLDIFLTDQQIKNPLFIQGDAFQMPIADSSIDFIFALWTVFHYEPLSQFGNLLKEVHRILTPGGAILIPSLSDPERLYQINACGKRLGFSTRIHLASGIVECKRI